MEIATLAGGCFWCTEAIFQRLKGVTSVTPGYTGGHINNPSYEEVSKGNTGHAEAIQITFDPRIISYSQLLDIFWQLHDPTTLNRQGSDVGSQYRSAIFHHDENQKKVALAAKTQLEKSAMYKNPIVTEIVPFKKFYKAEKYHKDYYNQNKGNTYCRIVIDPKIQKLYKEFKKVTKNET
ncbi:peptide-methionine (S)-S-oxide reductase MsrA [Candidatus Woesebacteria bacterium]|nr:peptide-methionine (S)-S-oxide reductase MsrA [Candidatus Woesebacteria bacterium]